MTNADEDVIVIAPDGSEDDSAPVQPVGVEVIVEGEEPATAVPSAIDDLDDIEPMPATQRGVLIVVVILIVLGIAALIAYWTGLLGG